jgi:hypothetical protein
MIRILIVAADVHVFQLLGIGQAHAPMIYSYESLNPAAQP